MHFGSARTALFLGFALAFVFTACDSGGGGMGAGPETDPGNTEAVINGKVTETEGDAPIGGADLTVFRADEDKRLGQATTDSTGSYEVSFTVPEDDAPDQLAIEVGAEGFAAKTDTVGFDPSLTRDVSLEALCISSGKGSAIQSVLGDGRDAMLCKGAEFDVQQKLNYTTDGQSIYTEGRPPEEGRAVLKIDTSDLTTVIKETDQADVTLRSVIVDGNRPEYGYKDGEALLIFGRDARGATVTDVKAKNTRSWSTLHLPRWGGECRGITVESSTFGPAGTADGRWADGISLACEDAEVTGNSIVDATDGGIVIFGATGSTVKDNTIIAKNRTLLGGINMVDYGNDENAIHSDYSGTTVEGNTIDAEGALIKIALGMGPSVWNWCHHAGDRNRGGTVKNNTLEGDHMGYGFVVDGVTNWTVTGNADNSSHIGDPGTGCAGNKMPDPKGFLINRDRSEGTFQESFEGPGVPLHGGLELESGGG
jgi:hypothetical protein